MEIDSRFWKIHKKSWKLKGILLQNGVVPFFHPAFQYKGVVYVIGSNFIALIHPIQWTIAYPVGADRPAKRQKKTSCVSTSRSVRSTSALARWRVVLPSCLDRVTS